MSEPDTREVGEVPSGVSLEQSPAQLQSTPVSRSGIYIWAILTWCMAISFAILVMVMWTVEISDNGGPVYKRSHTVPHNMGVWVKNSWKDWTATTDIYKTPGPAIVATMSTGAGSTAILDLVMRSMLCHGNLPASIGTGPLKGGLNGVVKGTDYYGDMSFWFASDLCQCVQRQHTKFYANVSKSATTADLVLQLGGQFTSGIVTTGLAKIPEGQDLMRACLFGTRATQMTRVDDTHALTVSPYMLIVHVNIVAGVVACLYLMAASWTGTEEARNNASFWGIVSLGFGDKVVCVVLAAVNLALGVAATVISAPPDSIGAKSIWPILQGIMFITTSVCVGVISMGEKSLSFGNNGSSKIKQNMIVHQENIRVWQRMVFWMQFLCTAPAILLLHDAMAQQRDEVYLTHRLIFLFGIIALAAGSDMVAMFYENMSGISQHKTTAQTEDMLRSCMWYTWTIWTIASTILVYSSGTVFMDATTANNGFDIILVNIAFVIYFVGMPLVSIPGMASMNTKHMKWANSPDVTALAMRLVVDVLARMLLTLAGIFWLYRAE